MFQSFVVIVVSVAFSRFQFIATAVPSRKQGCVTKLNFIPRKAVAGGVDPGDILQVTCFTPLWPSPLPSLLSLTLGISARSDGNGISEEIASSTPNESDERDDNDNNNNNNKENTNTNNDGKQKKLVTTRMIIAKLVPLDNDKHLYTRGRNRALPRVTVSPVFRDVFNTTASLQVPSAGVGLGLQLRLSASCALSSRAFFCAATSCRAWHYVHRGACTDHVAETLESLPVFVRGCRSPASSRPGVTSPTCTLLPFQGDVRTSAPGPIGVDTTIPRSASDDRGVDDTDQRSSTSSSLRQPALQHPIRSYDERQFEEEEVPLVCGQCVGGTANCQGGRCVLDCLAGYYGPSCRKPCPKGTWGIQCSARCNCSAKCVCSIVDGRCSRCFENNQIPPNDPEATVERATEEETEVASSFIIMGVSFFGGYIVGASLAGVCWCVRMGDQY